VNKFIPARYLLFAFASAIFLGCFLFSIKFINSFIMMPVLALVCLFAFLNRKNKAMLIFPSLVLAMLFGAFLYHQEMNKQSSLMQFTGKTITLQAIAAEDPIPTTSGNKLLLKDVYYIQNNKMYKCVEKVQLYIGKEDKLRFGDQLKFIAEIEPIANLRNFGDFDFLKYYKSKGIYVKAYTAEITKLVPNKGGFFATLMHNCNVKIKSTIFLALPKTEAALLYGILTGSKTEIDPDVMQVFSRTGLAHILSVSGLHVGFLVLLLTYLLKPFKLSKKLHSVVVFVIVLIYILLIGAPVPAVRALLMLAVMLGGNALGKKYDLNASASLGTILLLVYNPLLIHDPSFIISFACIYAISFFHQPINHAIRFMPILIRSSIALSVAVWIGITPILIFYFNYISMINILLNVLAVPIAFLITLAGFVAVIVGIIFQPLSIFIFAASYYLIKVLYFISEKSLLLPFAGFNIPSLGWYSYMIYYLGASVLIEDFWKYKSLGFKRKYKAVIAIGICLVIFINLMPSSSMKIYYLDVGQGDSSVIKTPNNKVIVVDGGGSGEWEKSNFNVGEKLTLPALRHLGIWQIDTVIVSHIHDDHLGGVISILESYKVKRVMLPDSDKYGEGEFTSANFEKLKAICKAKKISVIYLKGHSSIKVSKNVELSVLAPDEPYIQGTDSDVNNSSMVFKLRYKEFDALFTGDIQAEAELRLLDKDIQCDVLKVAHHGSPYSSTEYFIELADPEVSIISVGRNNYGHPSEEIIERLKQNESQVYRTDLSGAVMLSTDGKSLSIRTVR
jgi:competence protein ComEC